MKAFKRALMVIRHEPGVAVLAVLEVVLITFTVKAVISHDPNEAVTLMIFAASAALTMRRWIRNHLKDHK